MFNQILCTIKELLMIISQSCTDLIIILSAVPSTHDIEGGKKEKQKEKPLFATGGEEQPGLMFGKVIERVNCREQGSK